MSDQAVSSFPLSVPCIGGNEWKYVKDCLDTGWVSSVGSYVNRFENMVSSHVGVKYAVATVNGTSALHISLIVNGVNEEDEVIVPTLTFVATANAVQYCRARPVFMDCDRDTLCLDIEKFSTFLNDECAIHADGYTYNKATNRRVKAIIPVHIFGHPLDMEPLIELCLQYNIAVIEDATESLGSLYKGKHTGSFGYTGCFSFNGNKIITTGGGGMIVANDEAIAEKARHLTTQAKCDPIEYDHDDIGYNYRLTNVQAAIGVAQMEELSRFIAIKRRNAETYRALFSQMDEVEFLWEKKWARSNFWFYTIKVPPRHKDALIAFLSSHNIQVRPVWKLIHSLPMYAKCQNYLIENALHLYESCVNIPCSVNLKRKEINYVAMHVKDYFNKHTIQQ